MVRHKADPIIFKGYQEVQLNKKEILEIWSKGGLTIIGAPGAGRVNVVNKVIMTIDPDSDNFSPGRELMERMTAVAMGEIEVVEDNQPNRQYSCDHNRNSRIHLEMILVVVMN